MKEINYLKIESYESIRLFIHYWKVGIETLSDLKIEKWIMKTKDFTILKTIL